MQAPTNYEPLVRRQGTANVRLAGEAVTTNSSTTTHETIESYERAVKGEDEADLRQLRVDLVQLAARR